MFCIVKFTLSSNPRQVWLQLTLHKVLDLLHLAITVVSSCSHSIPVAHFLPATAASKSHVSTVSAIMLSAAKHCLQPWAGWAQHWQAGCPPPPCTAAPCLDAQHPAAHTAPELSCACSPSTASRTAASAVVSWILSAVPLWGHSAPNAAWQGNGANFSTTFTSWKE